MNDKNLIRRCKALAVHACANWRDHECLARDCPCDMANPRYATIHDGALNCDYFLSSVLPLDKELNRLVWCSIFGDGEHSQPHIRFCTTCGSAYIPTSPRQRYCIPCGIERKRQRSREKQRRYTERKRAKQQA